MTPIERAEKSVRVAIVAVKIAIVCVAIAIVAEVWILTR